ncbi:hypothetical protein HCJ92_06530, partial [Streptomyces sp. ventii]|nr:hypothetical protein [Streptomyces spiramenti]
AEADSGGPPGAAGPPPPTPPADTLPPPVGGRQQRASTEALRRLAADPSVRQSEAGRRLLQWLHSHVVLDDTWQRHIEAVPPHRAGTVAEVALQSSRVWKRFGEELTRRKFQGHSAGTDTADRTDPRNRPPHLGS